jgi:hypothetical protein
MFGSKGRTKRNKHMWGCMTDSISLVFLACWLFYGLATASVPNHVKIPIDERQWFAYVSRLLVPGIAIWVWGIAIGNGLTAKLFSAKFVVDYLAPASYNMFLLHQPVSEWYFLATRHTWWAYCNAAYSNRDVSAHGNNVRITHSELARMRTP